MANKVITLETDWGAPGAQLTGAEVQGFIKRTFTDIMNVVEFCGQEIIDAQNNIEKIIPNAFSLTSGCSIAYIADDDTIKSASVRSLLNINGEMITDAIEIIGVWVNIEGNPPIVVAMEDFKCRWAVRNYQNFDDITRGGRKLATDYNIGYDRTLRLSDEEGNFINSAGNFDTSHAIAIASEFRGEWQQWWIPSVAELMAIYKNKAAINFCLELIGGNPLREDWHWSVIEATKELVWCMNFKNGKIGYAEGYATVNNLYQMIGHHYKTSQHYLRPVTTPYLWDTLYAHMV